MNNLSPPDLLKPEEAAAQAPVSFSFQDYPAILLKRRWTVLWVFCSLVGAVTLYCFSATPIYQATTQILVERQQPRVLETRVGPAAENYPGEEFYQTQYKLLESPVLVKKVIEKLNLKAHPAYSRITAAAEPEAASGARAENRLMEAVAAGLTVTPVRNSSLVNLSYDSPDPQLAARMVNTFAESFIEYSLDLRFAASQEAARWLQHKLAEARKKLEESEARLNHYKREHHIVALEDKESLTAQKLEHLTKELLAAQTRRLEAETRFKEVSEGRPIREVLANPLIQTLKAEEAKIIGQISELSKKYGEKHPRMLQLASELAANRAKIGAEMKQISQSIKNEYKMAQMQEENLRQVLEHQKKATQELSEVGVQYRVLLRDVETNRALYENILKSFKETTATENLPATNIRIIYPATVPEMPVKPKKLRYIMLATVMGAVLGMAAALGLESLDSTLKTPEEVEHWLKLPNLAVIPRLEPPAEGNSKELPQVMLHHDRQPLLAEAYRRLRTSILFSTPGRAPQVLLVSSTMPLEGKTATAANLAAAMANAEGPVLLVEADLRRPSLHQIFQVEREPGLSNFLVGETNELPVRQTAVPRLYLLPCGKIPPNPSELLGSGRMQELLARVRERFARIIVDSPPLLSVTDPAILATMVTGVLLVVKAESVPRRAALAARDQLLEVHAPLLGAVLNAVPGPLPGQGYYQYHAPYAHHGPAKGERPVLWPPRMRPARGWLSPLKGCEGGRRPGSSNLMPEAETAGLTTEPASPVKKL